MSTSPRVHEPLAGLRRHQLMPRSLRTTLPALYATEDVAVDDKVLHAAFFCPFNGWHWYVAEFDGDDRCFGYVDGSCREWGYFSLSELAGLTVGPGVPAVERDLHFQLVRFVDLMS